MKYSAEFHTLMAPVRLQRYILDMIWSKVRKRTFLWVFTLHRQEENEKLRLFSLKMPKRLSTLSDHGRFISKRSLIIQHCMDVSVSLSPGSEVPEITLVVLMQGSFTYNTNL